MATISELTPYLEQGLTLRGGMLQHETLTPEQSESEGIRVRWDEYLMESEWAKPRYYTIEQLKELAAQNAEHQKKEHERYKAEKERLKSLDILLNFGKHQGKHLSEVPSDYLEWIVQNIKDKPALTDTIEEYRFIKEHQGPEDYNGLFDFDWGVEFASVRYDANGKWQSMSEYHIIELQRIEKAIQDNTPRFLFGKLYPALLTPEDQASKS